MSKFYDVDINGILKLINGQDACEDVLTELRRLNNNINSLLSKVLCPQVFVSKESQNITFQAPFDCWVYATMSFLGWGYAGALYTWELKCDDSDITNIVTHFAGCQGGDLQNKQMTSVTMYKGLKKGNSYTFYKQDNISSQGTFNNAIISVICFPEFNNQDAE